MLRVATLVLALSACVAETGDEGMYVLNNSAISGDSCALNGSSMQAFLPRGEIFALSPAGYLLTPLVESKLAVVEGQDPTLKTIQLHSADVELTVKAISVQHADSTFTSSQPNTTLAQFTSLFSGAVPPGGSVNVAFDVLPAPTISSLVAMAGADVLNEVVHIEMLASVTIKGDLGGDDLEAAPYFYPISICNDCVVNVLGTCPIPMGTAPREGNACNRYQDGVVDCCRDTTVTPNRFICPATVATM